MRKIFSNQIARCLSKFWFLFISKLLLYHINLLKFSKLIIWFFNFLIILINWVKTIENRKIIIIPLIFFLYFILLFSFFRLCEITSNIGISKVRHFCFKFKFKFRDLNTCFVLLNEIYNFISSNKFKLNFAHFKCLSQQAWINQLLSRTNILINYFMHLLLNQRWISILSRIQIFSRL
jgi:hypothetical protein